MLVVKRILCASLRIAHWKKVGPEATTVVVAGHEEWMAPTDNDVLSSSKKCTTSTNRSLEQGEASIPIASNDVHHRCITVTENPGDNLYIYTITFPLPCLRLKRNNLWTTQPAAVNIDSPSPKEHLAS